MDVKKQKVRNRENKGKEVDRISSLSDIILHHILSYLPIEEVVTTSILSTRWRYLWASLPILNFQYIRSYTRKQNQTRATKFMNFVDRFLLSHNTNIKKFTLNYVKEVDESRVNDWISKVMRNEVEELSFYMNVKCTFAFSPNLITCESLVKLTIDGNFALKLPMSTYFSSLKILHLVNVVFSDDYLTQQFFSNCCQALEELRIDNCRWDDMKSLCISGSSLKRLEIDGIRDWEGDGLCDCVLEIDAPNLVYLNYSCCLPKDYILSNFSSLTHACICLDETESSERSDAELGYCASKFLGRLSNVKDLKISGETIEIFFNAKYPLSSLPTFHNLIRLEVSSNLHYLSGRSLLDLLQISPNLEYLVFAEEVTTEKECWTFENVPQCLLLHLKEVKFRRFVGNGTEFYALKYLLKNARVLERITISSYYSPKDPNKNLEIVKQLLRLPRCSTNSVVQFI